MNAEQGIVEVNSYGDVSLRHLRPSREWVKLIVKQADFSRVLVDTTELKALPGSTSLNEFGSSLPPSAKFAAVVPDEQETAKNVTLLLGALNNQGGVGKSFFSKRPALAWLKS
jgi:hypothetical protein